VLPAVGMIILALLLPGLLLLASGKSLGELASTMGLRRPPTVPPGPPGPPEDPAP
jgi:hypothetical protein